MSCTIYKDGVPIAEMDPSTKTYDLEEYDIDSCYNIFCENDDDPTATTPFIKFTGDFYNKKQKKRESYHDAWQIPYWLGGENGCMDLAPSCEELSVKIESWRNPSPQARGTPEEAEYMCAAKTLTCTDVCKPKLCDGKDDKFTMYRYKAKDGKDGKCEEKCVKEKDFDKKTADGYSFCPCDKTPPNELPPQSCVLKRSSQLFKFEEWPERDDVNIEIQVVATQKIYTFNRDSLDTSVPEFYIENMDVFMDLKNAQDASGIQFRFNGKRGAGGWNTCKYSPIALDLDGSGAVEFIDKEVTMDITGDGDVEELSQWFAPTEGILIFNHGINDGVVTGVHLMGDMGGQFEGGFQKLATYDKDGNGIVEGNELNKFAIWVDVNSNAKIDEEDDLYEDLEEDLGIIGLHTAHNNHVSSAIMADGTEMMMEDLWFTR